MAADGAGGGGRDGRASGWRGNLTATPGKRRRDAPWHPFPATPSDHGAGSLCWCVLARFRTSKDLRRAGGHERMAAGAVRRPSKTCHRLARIQSRFRTRTAMSRRRRWARERAQHCLRSTRAAGWGAHVFSEDRTRCSRGGQGGRRLSIPDVNILRVERWEWACQYAQDGASNARMQPTHLLRLSGTRDPGGTRHSFPPGAETALHDVSVGDALVEAEVLCKRGSWEMGGEATTGKV